MSHVGVQWSFPAFSCCVELQEVHHYWRCSSPLPKELRKGCSSMSGPSRSSGSFLPSRYQEGLKKTKELQDLKEEEEEQKSESPEEPEEVEETEEEEKDPRSRWEACVWRPEITQSGL